MSLTSAMKETTSAMNEMRLHLSKASMARHASVDILRTNALHMMDTIRSNRLESEKRNRSDRVRTVRNMLSDDRNSRNAMRSSMKKSLDSFMADLRNSDRVLVVQHMLADNQNSRNAMRSSMKKSLDSFMADLRGSTAELLNGFKKERALIAADVMDAKAQWAAHKIKWGASKKILHASPSNETARPAAPVITDVSELRGRILDCIKGAAEGITINSIVKSLGAISENISVSDILSTMIEEGLIKFYRFKYFIVEDVDS